MPEFLGIITNNGKYVFCDNLIIMLAEFRRLVPLLSSDAGTFDTNSLLNFNNQ